MDSQRFDELSRAITTRLPRRTWLGGLASGLLATLALALGVGRLELEAKKKKGKKGKKGKKKAKTFSFLASPMTGAQEVAPTDGDDNGSGSASFRVKGNLICGTFNFTTSTPGSVSGTHIHEAPAGANGPIVVDFGIATLGVETCLNCATSACKPGVLGQIKANPAGFYANIHTSPNHTGGAVRGQLQRV